MQEKINKFVAMLEHDQLEQLIKDNLACDGNVLGRKVHVEPKKKYININIGGSGAYMVDKETETIYGIKAYGVPHKGQVFGTLDTIGDYDWSGYRAVHRAKNRPETLLSTENILQSRGKYIGTDGRIYDIGVAEPMVAELVKKVFTSNRYEELIEDLKQAKHTAITEAFKVFDIGTCNLDGIFLTLKGFNEDKTIEAIKQAGLSGFKTDHDYFGKGYYISADAGQALKNEKAAEAMYEVLKGKGYDVCHWYQMD
jgi:hypothetical protein